MIIEHHTRSVTVAIFCGACGVMLGIFSCVALLLQPPLLSFPGIICSALIIASAFGFLSHLHCLDKNFTVSCEIDKTHITITDVATFRTKAITIPIADIIELKIDHEYRSFFKTRHGNHHYLSHHLLSREAEITAAIQAKHPNIPITS